MSQARHLIRPGQVSPAEFIAGGVAAGDYDRSRLGRGWVHLAVGNFFRAHACVYLDDLFATGEGQDFGIVGVSLLPNPGDVALEAALPAQGGQYTVTQRMGDRTSTRLVRSLVEYEPGYRDFERAVDRIADPTTRIVSMTVSEAGYHVRNGTLDRTKPDVQADLTRTWTGHPRTLFGYLCEGLRRRFRRDPSAGLTLLSLDNMPGNGHVLRHTLSDFIRETEPTLLPWLEARVTFPNSMVDRITPAATAEDRAELETRYQIQDAAAVVSEPMPLIGWAVEDTFAAGRPPLERVGVRFVEDVTGYEKLKLRLLNAGHSALAYPGILCGHRYIHEALGNPAIAGLLEAFWRESQGTLSAVSGVSPQDYCRNLWERFGNQALRDTTERVSSDGSGKIPSFVVPIARECIAAGRPPRMCGLIVAAWIRHLGGVDDQGQAFRVIDPQADQLRPLALGDVSGLRALLARADIFADLAGNETFATAVETALRLLRERGVAQTIQAALGSAR